MSSHLPPMVLVGAQKKRNSELPPSQLAARSRPCLPVLQHILELRCHVALPRSWTGSPENWRRESRLRARTSRFSRGYLSEQYRLPVPYGLLHRTSPCPADQRGVCTAGEFCGGRRDARGATGVSRLRARRSTSLGLYRQTASLCSLPPPHFPPPPRFLLSGRIYIKQSALIQRLRRLRSG